MSSRARIGIVVGAVVILVVGFVIASGSGDDDKSKPSAAATQTTAAPTSTVETTTDMEGGTPTVKTVTAPPAPAIPTVTVKDGKPVGGIKKLKFTKGDTIAFKVVADAPGEIHFHGYDIPQEVKTAGGSTTFKVKATIEGRFVVELEASGQQIAEVEVDPS
jgi:FtsP/CotA-like multicopper oxidase with cupredoxin domain